MLYHGSKDVIISSEGASRSYKHLIEAYKNSEKMDFTEEEGMEHEFSEKMNLKTKEWIHKYMI